MAFYCQNMLEIALILTEYDAVYEEVAFKFVEHFVGSTRWMIGENQDEMWMKRTNSSMTCCDCPTAGDASEGAVVGLLPLCASTVFDGKAVRAFPS
jgi:hypothetical protein